MIEQSTLSEFKLWYSEYVKSFHSKDPAFQRNIDIKDEHTKRVCSEIVDLGKSISLSPGELRMAEAIALFHDIGRYPQYKRYGTFSDRKSENHAKLGITILEQHNVLTIVDPDIRKIMICAIGYHNRFSLPENETEDCLLFTKLLRDADKLDIWKVVTDYYRRKDKTKNEALEFGLPDLPEISPQVLEDLINEKIVDVSHLNTLNDFKVLQLSWIYDINFPKTYQLIRDRQYIDMIQETLPHSKETDRAFSQLQAFLNKRCGVQG